MKITIKMSGNDWLVEDDRGLLANWHSPEGLEWAALFALDQSKASGTEPELGEGVPPDALDQGRRLLQRLKR